MAIVAEVPKNPAISVDTTDIPAALSPSAFRAAYQAVVDAIEDKAQLAVAYLEELHEAIGNGSLSGGTISAGAGLAVNVTALKAFVGTVTENNAVQVVAVAASATNSLFLRQNGTWTVNTTGAVPTDITTHGAYLLWGTATTSVGAVTAVTNTRAIFSVGGGVTSFAKSGSAALTGAVTISSGTGILLTQAAQNVQISMLTGYVESMKKRSVGGVDGTAMAGNVALVETQYIALAEDTVNKRITIKGKPEGVYPFGEVVRTLTFDFTPVDTDGIIHCTNTTAITVTLPNTTGYWAEYYGGKCYVIHASGTATVAVVSGFDSSTLVTLYPGQTSVFYGSTTQWYLLPVTTSARRKAITFASDANKTLNGDESGATIIEIGTGTALTVTRNIVFPLLDGRSWLVNNQSSGAQSVQCIGATGTGVTIATAKAARIYSDGTNIKRETADVTP